MDEAPWVLLGLALILYVLSTPFVAWRAFLRGRAFEARLRGLEERFAGLEGRVVAIGGPASRTRHLPSSSRPRRR